jgi:RimJ/RimL family protein N-acetyltransferase
VIRLAPLAEHHEEDLAGLIADPDVQRFTLIPVPPPRGFARTWLERYLDGQRTGERLGFAAYDEQGRFCGVGLVVRIDREGAEAELGYIVAPRARGRGTGAEILEALTTFALQDLGMLRLTLMIDTANTASQRVAARAGYTLEGVMRSLAFKDGRRTDAQLWSRLPDDPAPPPR